MPLWAAAALTALALAGLAIDLYFTTFLHALPGWLVRLLKGGAGACGIDGGICRRVFGTQYARIFFGIPTVYIGLAWHGALLALSVVALATGVFHLLVPMLAVAVASVLTGIYLTWVLLRVLHDP